MPRPTYQVELAVPSAHPCAPHDIWQVRAIAPGIRSNVINKQAITKFWRMVATSNIYLTLVASGSHRPAWLRHIGQPYPARCANIVLVEPVRGNISGQYPADHVETVRVVGTFHQVGRQRLWQRGGRQPRFRFWRRRYPLHVPASQQQGANSQQNQNRQIDQSFPFHRILLIDV